MRGRGYGGYWPVIPKDYWECYGLEPEPLRVIPTARQISRLDQVNIWLTWLDQETRQLVWLYCSGMSLRKLQNRLGRPKSTLHVNLHHAFLELMWRINNRRPKPMDVKAIITTHMQRRA